MQWREGEGLFIHPRWTAAAQQRIDDGEFGYLSAVFPYDTATGAVLQIRLAALTNDPGATGMKKADRTGGRPSRHPSTGEQTHE
ncbi:putative phage protease [Escherichia coli]|nr:putative phage protease [Escherichia coli]